LLSRLAAQTTSRSGAWSTSGPCRYGPGLLPDLSLVRHCHSVGYRRSPGLWLFSRSVSVCRFRMPLWSGLVVRLSAARFGRRLDTVRCPWSPPRPDRRRTAVPDFCQPDRSSGLRACITRSPGGPVDRVVSHCQKPVTHEGIRRRMSAVVRPALAQPGAREAAARLEGLEPRPSDP
jgi:hypothetical protein